MGKKVKRYEIDSFEKLCNVVSSENFDRISKDLCLWLLYNVIVMKKIRKDHPKETKNKTNWKLSRSSFIWVDDGKNDLKEVVIKNKETGEVQKIKFDIPNQ